MIPDKNSDSKNPKLQDFLLNHPQFRKSRLPSLYSDFRYLSHNNPDGYSANVTAWKALLTDATRQGLIYCDDLTDRSKLTFSTGPNLLSNLEIPEWGIPLALGVVLQEGIRQGEFIDVREFMDRRESIYSKGSWIPSPLSVVKWSLEKVGLFGAIGTVDLGSEGGVGKGSWVVVKNLEELGKKVVAEISMKAGNSRVGEIMDVETFAREILSKVLNSERWGSKDKGSADYSEGLISQTDINVLLKYLSRDLGEMAVSGTTLKFKTPHHPLTLITPADITVARLQLTISTLHLHLDMLSTRTSYFTSRAHSFLEIGNKTLAISSLRSKKLIEETIKKRTDTLHQLETVLHSIEEAGTNADIIILIDQSTRVLNQLNKEVGGVERTEDVMEKLRERIMDTEEISRVIAEGGGATVDEVELEDELEAMLRSENIKMEKMEKEIKERETRRAQAKVAAEVAEEAEEAEKKGKEKLEESMGSLTVGGDSEEQIKESENMMLTSS